MLVSTCQLTPIDLQPPGASAVTGDIPIELPVSPSSVDVDHELTRTVHFTHDGKSITFEIVNKRISLTELDSAVVEVDPIPHDNFERILKAIFRPCISRKARRVKPKSWRTIGTV